MIIEGARVRMKTQAKLVRQHPELAGAIGVVGSVLHGPAWKVLGASMAERSRDLTAHLRFRDMNLIALNVPARDIEPVDRLSPDRLAG